MTRPGDFQSAIDFVNRHGNLIERARLRFLLDGQPATVEARETFDRSQRSDGGWAPPWSPEYSSIDATCFQMTLATQAGIKPPEPLIVDAVRFLVERQQFDGSWQEEESEATHAPPWARPDDTSAHLYLTANAGLRLAMTGLVPSAAREAAEFLLDRRRQDGSLPSFLHTHWLAAALWQQTSLAGEVPATLGYLADRIPELSAGNVAWMILSLCEAGLPPADVAVATGLDRLLELRDPAGHWPPDESADNAVHVTIEALKALQLGQRLV